MNNAAYIVAGWTAVTLGIGSYTLLLLRKGRRLSTQVPPDRRRWATTPGGKS